MSTPRTLAETLRATLAAGAGIRLDGDRLDVDFGDAVVPTSLLEDLRRHAPGLKGYLARLEPADGPVDLRITVAGAQVPFAEWTPFERLGGDVIVIDTETESVDLDDPVAPPPRMAVAVAWDGGPEGFVIRPGEVVRFLEAHPKATFCMHNAPFDLEVIDRQEGLPDQAGIIWRLLDENRVICSQEMERLIRLAIDGTPPRFVSLDTCAERYLGIGVEKGLVNLDGTPLRVDFGRFVGKFPREIPPAHLEYAATDAVATMMIWRHQQVAVRKILREIAPTAYGFRSPEALADAWARFGPLSAHVQTKAAVIAKYLWRRGVSFDLNRREALIADLERIQEEAAEKLRAGGIFVPKPGEIPPTGSKAVPTAMRERLLDLEPKLLAEGKISAPFERTKSGLLCIDAEQQAAWADAGIDPLVTAYADFKRAEKALGYAVKLDQRHAHPRWRSMKASGRFSCDGVAVQTFPKCGRGTTVGNPTIRQLVVPTKTDSIFAIVDFAALEVRSLAAAWKHQLGFGDGLYRVVEDGLDVHTEIAKVMLGREPTKAERNQIKPTTFGAPAGMTAGAIVANAKAAYGQILTLEQVERTLAAYKQLAPELEQHLRKTRDVGWAAKTMLGLKTKGEGWKILSMLAGKLEDRNGEVPADDVVAGWWDLAQAFASIMPSATAADRARLKALADRKPSRDLAGAVRKALTIEAVVTMSGRIRGKCGFTESRNGVFQGSAADGAILATWKLIRAGVDVVLFVHDEIVAEIPNIEGREADLKAIEKIMIDAMSEALGGIRVEVEGMLSRSWSHLDKVVDAPGPRVSTMLPQGGEADGAVDRPPTTPKPGKKSLLKGTVKGPAERKKVESRGNRKAAQHWRQQLEAGGEDDGSLPF